MKLKAFFITFKKLSMKQIPQFFLEVESPTLIKKLTVNSHALSLFIEKFYSK